MCFHVLRRFRTHNRTYNTKHREKETQVKIPLFRLNWTFPLPFQPIQEGGDNFSLGQRQLLCLCRDVLVKNPCTVARIKKVIK